MDKLDYPYGGAPVNNLTQQAYPYVGVPVNSPTQPLLGDFQEAFSDVNWRRSVEQRLADLTSRVALLEAAATAAQCISPNNTLGLAPTTWGGPGDLLARTWG